MSKRLILILALVFVVGITAGAYAEVQNVKVSGDITAYGISRNLQTKGNKDFQNENAMATITRVRVDADLTDNVTTTVRLLNERYWGNEIDNVGTNNANTDVALDLAYVTLKEFLYSPLTFTVGRQELHFGNDMIVGDVDTNNNASTASPFGQNRRDKDLSARKAFDAIRATLNYDPLVIDGIVAQVRNNDLYTADDVMLYGVNANYKAGNFKMLKNNIIEGYWFLKQTGRENGRSVTAATTGVFGKKVEDTVHVIGARVSTQPMDNMTYQLEGAYQFGRYVPQAAATPPNHTVARKAWAIETALTYDWKKVKYTPSTSLLYAYFSGDHENNTYTTARGAYRGWDPMYENQKYGDIANALFNQTNAHIIGGVATAKPMDDITLKGEYYAFIWAKPYHDGATITATARDSGANLIMTQRRFAGQEIDLTATYDYTEDVQLALMGGMFFPGASFAKGNDSAATEVIGSMKVTF
ncbi:MAG: alginate export family protein [Candidatus Omnitrophica bacterium]|nr:alginate export family protein [Candidatus Omnitrophota bacterium]